MTRQEISWILYDIGNSAFVLVMITALMPIFFKDIAAVGMAGATSTAYGRDLGFGVTFLIVVLLFIQIVAFPFALLFGRLARVFSAKRMLLTGIAVYCLATFLAFLLPSIADNSSKIMGFWVIAFLVASSMGGIQALSRSYFGKLIPAEKSAEFFGLFTTPSMIIKQ